MLKTISFETNNINIVYVRIWCAQNMDLVIVTFGINVKKKEHAPPSNVYSSLFSNVILGSRKGVKRRSGGRTQEPL
jgi:hypothetical protein